MFKKGDRVVYAADPRKLKGTVVDLYYDGYFQVPSHATVQFDDWTFHPNTMKISVVELEYLQELGRFTAANMDNCTCGLKFCREGGRHSTWCNMYRGND